MYKSVICYSTSYITIQIWYQFVAYEGVTQQTRCIEPLLVKCWPAVYDVGPTLNQHWFNVSYSLGITQYMYKSVICFSTSYITIQIWYQFVAYDYVYIVNNNKNHTNRAVRAYIADVLAKEVVIMMAMKSTGETYSTVEMKCAQTEKKLRGC